MPPDQAKSWEQLLALTYDQLMQQIVVFAPKLFGALSLIMVGIFVAFILAKVTRTIVLYTQRVLVRVFPSVFAKSGIRIRSANVNAVSKVVFWLVLLFFTAAGANSLGLDMISSWMGTLLLYLPKLIVGLLIMVGGYLVSNMIEVMVVSATESAGSKNAVWIGRVTQFAVFFTAIVIGVEQFGINIHFFTQFVIVMAAILVGGFALAFALGAKNLVANIIGAQQAGKFLRLGDEVSISGVEGVIVEISTTMLVVESHQGRMIIPAKFFMESIGSIKSAAAIDKAK